MKIVRLALPLLAVVAIGVGAACTPVKQQLGKNILAYTIGNGCLPTLSDGLFVGDSDKSNSTRVGANESREVCTGGFAGNQVGPQGVTLQVVNDGIGDSNGLTGSSAGFVTGGLNQLGQIGSMKVSTLGGSNNVSVTLVMDKNKDGQFLCPAGSATALCGDAIAVFRNGPNAGNGHEYVFNDMDLLGVTGLPDGLFTEPCAAGPPGCYRIIGGGLTFGELKKGKVAGIGGDTPTVLSFSASATPATGTADVKATVTQVQVNGMNFLP